MSSEPLSDATPVRAAIYCRISQDKTGERAGVRPSVGRLPQARRGARAGKVIASCVHRQDISAFSGKHRPEYEALLDGIGSWADRRRDRVAPRPAAPLTQRIGDVHRSVSTARRARPHREAGAWDLSTPSGRAVARTLGAWARYESEHKADRIRAAKKQTALDGPASGRHPLLRIRRRQARRDNPRRRGRRDQTARPGGHQRGSRYARSRLN